MVECPAAVRGPERRPRGGLHHQESYPDDVEVAWRLAHEHWGNEAEVEDNGVTFQAVIYAITADQWRSRAPRSA